MRQVLLLFFNIILANVIFAQGVTKNGQITSSGSAYVSRNGAIGASNGVDKNGKIQAALGIGSSYQGGKIFYFFVSGDPGYVAGQTHGLIAADADLPDAYWGCAGSAVAGTRPELGYGNANTVAIVAGCTTAGIAAEACSSLSLNTYTDWYLPSINELLILMTNNALIGGFVTGPYTSSTQDASGAFNSKNFFTASDITNLVAYPGQKASVNHVRAIRTF